MLFYLHKWASIHPDKCNFSPTWMKKYTLKRMFIWNPRVSLNYWIYVKPKNSCFLVRAIMVDLELKTAFEKFSFRSDNLESNIVSSILPKNERKITTWVFPKEKMLGIVIFCSFFGRIEDTINCFWNFLTSRSQL